MARHHHLKHHPKRHISALDSFAYFFAIATPLLELPQAYQIYAHHSAHDVSLPTWLFFDLSSIVWIAYGAKRNLPAIVLSSALYMVFETIVVVGILLYR